MSPTIGSTSVFIKWAAVTGSLRGQRVARA